MSAWAVDLQGTAIHGGQAYPYLVGQAGHPCASCGDVSRYEYSPGKHRACSLACLAKQRPSATIVLAVKRRHGQDLSSYLDSITQGEVP